jgi:hypothetical protein
MTWGGVLTLTFNQANFTIQLFMLLLFMMLMRQATTADIGVQPF